MLPGRLVPEDPALEVRRLRELHRKMEIDLAVLRGRLESLERQLEESVPTVEEKIEPPPIPERVAPVKPRDPLPSIPLPVAMDAEEKESKPEATTPEMPPPLPLETVEMQLGRVWLVRAGIVTLLTGLVFLGNMTYQTWIAPLGAPGKLALLVLAAFILGGLGVWLSKAHEGLKYLSRGLMAGGGALFYYSTYAAHFVPALRVIESPLVAAVILMIVAGGFLGLVGKLGFQSAAIPTILLSYYVAAINPQGGAALFSNGLLAALAVVLVCWRGWVTLSFASLSGTYLSFLYWRWLYGGVSLSIEAAYLMCYWGLFTLLAFLARREGFREVVRACFLTVNNGAFFLVGSWAVVWHFSERYWLFPLGFGVVLLVLAGLGTRVSPRDRIFDGAFLSQALLLIGVGLATKLSGYQLALTSAVLATLYLYASSLWQRRVFLVFSLISAGVATGVALLDTATIGKVWPVALLLVGCMVGRKVMIRAEKRSYVDALALLYGLAGIFLLAVMGWRNFPLPHAIPILGGGSLLVLLLLRFHRLPELALSVHLWLATVLSAWFSVAEPALWISLFLLAVLLAGFHWWGSGLSRGYQEGTRMVFGALNAVGVAILLQGWVMRFGEPQALWLMPLLGSFLLAYGLWERARVFTWLSLGFSAQALYLCAASLMVASRSGELACVLILAVYTVLLSVTGCLRSRWAPALLLLRQIFSFCVSMLVIAYTSLRLDHGWNVVFLTGLAAGVTLIAGWRKKAEGLLYGAWFFSVALGALVLEQTVFLPGGGWAFLGAILALYGALYFSKHRLTKDDLVPGKVFVVAMVGALLVFWWQASRLAALHGQGALLTLVWCLVAVLVLALGFVLRDRATRLVGLGVLVACLARVYCVDVWKVDDFLRNISLVVLGIVLVAFSFLYGRFADWLKKFL